MRPARQMAAPFPILPRISDENLAKWMRQLGHRPRPKLQPVPSAPTIGGFSLTASVAAAPRDSPLSKTSGGSGSPMSDLVQLRSQPRSKLENLPRPSAAVGRSSPEPARPGSRELGRRPGSGEDARALSKENMTRSSSAPAETRMAAVTNSTGNISISSVVMARTQVRARKRILLARPHFADGAGSSSPGKPPRSPPQAHGRGEEAEAEAQALSPLSTARAEERPEAEPPPLPLERPRLPVLGRQEEAAEARAASPQGLRAGGPSPLEARSRAPSPQGARSGGSSPSPARAGASSPQGQQLEDKSPVRESHSRLSRRNSWYVDPVEKARVRAEAEAEARRRAEEEALRRRQLEEERRRREEERKRIGEERLAIEHEVKKRRTEKKARKMNILATKEAKLSTWSAVPAEPRKEEEEEKGLSAAEAAVAIQKCYRGFLVRRRSGEPRSRVATAPAKDEGDYEEDFENEDATLALSAEGDEEPVVSGPIAVDLPRWHPDLPPLDQLTRRGSKVSAEQLRAPTEVVVKCVGAGKITVRWELPRLMPLSLLWYVRLRAAGGGEWFIVDLDSGRAQPASTQTTTWKDRALVVQPGLRVWCYCIEGGQSSATPHFGTIVAHYPGLIVVDFDEHGRQRVPQDWVQFAATPKGAREMQDDLVAVIREATEQRRGQQLWRRVRRDWWRAAVGPAQTKQRTRRQCPLLCNVWREPPNPGDRLAVSCAMGIEAKASADSPKATVLASAYTWWPALLSEQRGGSPEDSDEESAPDWPKDLCGRDDLPVKLEPWPRVQVIPRTWLSKAPPQAEVAAKNACVGQQVLASYGWDPDREPSEDIEAKLMHPQPQIDGDVTLRWPQGEPEHNKSERAVRCQILRELLSPAEVTVDLQVAPASGQTLETRSAPLGAVLEVLGPAAKVWAASAKRAERQRVVHWEFKRNEATGRFEVFARQRPVRGLGALGEPTPLVPGVEVIFSEGAIPGPATMPATRHHGKKQARVLRVCARPSHFEVRFEDVVPEGVQHVSSDTICAVLQQAGPQRLQQPEVLIHDLPDSLRSVQVQVGVSVGAGHDAPEMAQVQWSAPSPSCTVATRDAMLQAPLGPVAFSTGVSKAEVRWLLPSSPPALCFKVRIRDTESKAQGRSSTRCGADWLMVESDYRGTGLPRFRSKETGVYWVQQADGSFAEQVWDLVSASGRSRGVESTMAWSTHIVPLVKDLWVLAYGSRDGQKTTTPSPAVVYDIVDEINVKIQFAAPSEELCIGMDREAFIERTMGGPRLRGLNAQKPQEIPIDWIQAVWVYDGEEFFKGKPSMSCRPGEIFFKASEEEGKYSMLLEAAGKEHMPGLLADASILSSSAYGATLQSEGLYSCPAMLGSLTVHGLDQQHDYEICVQALTKDGWTPWTPPALLHIERSAYAQQDLVVERAAGVTTGLSIKSPLLHQAFYKEYDLCLETIRDNLSEARYAAIGPILERQELRFNPNQRGRLVEMDGPVRNSGKAPSLEEAIRSIRKAVDDGVDVNHRDQSTGRTPLIYAVEYYKMGAQSEYKLEVIKELIALKAKVDAMNDARQTALSIATERGLYGVVRLLLDQGADATIVSREGVTALLAGKVRPGMNKDEQKDMLMCQELLREDRVPWKDFEEQVLNAYQEPVAAARAFLKLAFPEVEAPSKNTLFVTDSSTQLGKRICKLDRLRLYEQIMEVGDSDPEERERRGQLCGQRLLLPQMAASSHPPAPQECSLLTFYLLLNGVAMFCIEDARRESLKLLEKYEVKLKEMLDGLSILPKLTEKAQMYCGIAAPDSKQHQLFNGQRLHQWHAHGPLRWLTEEGAVNAFEEFIKGGSFTSLEGFCDWVGELNAQIWAKCDPDHTVQLGAWDPRLPHVFWGAAYVQWLLSEAARAGHVFNEIGDRIAREVGGSVEFNSAPNKGRSRVETKQKDYASPGLTLLHEALDLMPGCFRCVLRADLGRVHEVPGDPKYRTTAAAVLVLGLLAPAGQPQSLETAVTAVKDVSALARATAKAAAEGKPEDDPLVACEEAREAMDAAVQSLRNLKRNHMQEIRSWMGGPGVHPPTRALLAFEAVCALLGLMPSHGAEPKSPSSAGSADCWSSFVEEFLPSGQPDLEPLAQQLAEFNMDSISDDAIALIEPAVKNKDFQPQQVQKSPGGAVCGPLCSWVHAVYKYHEASQVLRSTVKGLAGLGAGPDAKVARPLVLVALLWEEEATEEDAAAAEARLRETGADAVVWQHAHLLEGGGARRLLIEGLSKARASRGLAEELVPPSNISSETAQVLFDIRKSKTGNTNDLLCAGGLLDLVRGSLVCETEEEVRNIYDYAMGFTIKDDGCQVVRVKNGFQTPGAGGYADLKLFLYIARDAQDGEAPVYHICELQAHLKAFLDCKKYTHLPYEIDRGDFDPS